MVLRIVRSHHERMDGSGFPDGLRGDAIPLEARMVAVVDAFDAMTTNRAYRSSRSPAEAIRRAAALRGRPFRRRRGRGLPREHSEDRHRPSPSAAERHTIHVRYADDQCLRDAGPCRHRSHPGAGGPACRRPGRWAARARRLPPGDRARVVLGRDARTSGPMFAHAAAAGLMSVGVDVIDLGVVPTPTVQIAVEHHHAGAGLILTASHNPIEWNALKFVGPDGIFLDAAAGERSARWRNRGRRAPAGTASARSGRIPRPSPATSTRSSGCR